MRLPAATMQCTPGSHAEDRKRNTEEHSINIWSFIAAAFSLQQSADRKDTTDQLYLQDWNWGMQQKRRIGASLDRLQDDYHLTS